LICRLDRLWRLRVRLRLRINRAGLRIYGSRLRIYRGLLVIHWRRGRVIRRRGRIIRRRSHIHAIWIWIRIVIRVGVWMIHRDAKTDANAYPSGLERRAHRSQNRQNDKNEKDFLCVHGKPPANTIMSMHFLEQSCHGSDTTNHRGNSKYRFHQPFSVPTQSMGTRVMDRHVPIVIDRHVGRKCLIDINYWASAHICQLAHLAEINITVLHVIPKL
jgi:hypothetical protein